MTGYPRGLSSRCGRRRPRAGGAPKEASAHEAFELVLRPGDHLRDGLAGLQLGEHRRMRAALIHLYRDVGRSRRAGDIRNALVPGPDRIVIDGPLRWLDLLPDLEIDHFGEWRQVVADDDVAARLDLFDLHQVRDEVLDRRL